jgi:hypothetical protein
MIKITPIRIVKSIKRRLTVLSKNLISLTFCYFRNNKIKVRFPEIDERHTDNDQAYEKPKYQQEEESELMGSLRSPLLIVESQHESDYQINTKKADESIKYSNAN